MYFSRHLIALEISIDCQTTQDLKEYQHSSAHTNMPTSNFNDLKYLPGMSRQKFQAPGSLEPFSRQKLPGGYPALEIRY